MKQSSPVVSTAAGWRRLLWTLALVLLAAVVGASGWADTAPPAGSEPAAVHAGHVRPHVPPEARFGVLGTAQPTPFAAEIREIVDAMSFSTYDGALRDLSGERSVTVGAVQTLLTTRYSLSPGGRMAVEYARGRLKAMGYEVDSCRYALGTGDQVDLVARIPGASTPDRVYVLAGHLDSISEQPFTLAPGAEDNASGSAGVLTAAAALAGRRFASTIELVLFTGEEQLLKGSTAYVKEARAEGRDIRGAVVLDMISFWKDNYGILIDGDSKSESLMQVVGDAVDAYTGLSHEFTQAGLLSDHQSFQAEGIPAVLLLDRDFEAYGDYHRSTDVYANTDPHMGVEVARAAAAAVAQLAVPVGDLTGGPAPPPGLPRLRVGPNPARAYAEIDGTGNLPVAVYDVAGRLVRRLPPSPAGTRWNLRDGSGRRLPPGLYWVRSGPDSRRVTVLP